MSYNDSVLNYYITYFREHINQIAACYLVLLLVVGIILTSLYLGKNGDKDKYKDDE